MTAPTEIPWRDLAEFPETELPVISLYLDMRPDSNNKKVKHEYFFQNELRPRLGTFKPHTPEHESFQRDVERIERYVNEELRASADAVAIFACAGADDFFEAIPLDAPIERNALHVYSRPHLYPLLKVNDQFPRYLAVVLDTHMARIFTFGMNALQESTTVENRKFNRTDVGGYSQKRYQRHVDNWRDQHMKEVAEWIDRLVREERIEQVILAGDEVAIPMLRDQLTPRATDAVVDVLSLDITTSEKQILEATLAAMREHDVETDEAVVERMRNDYLAGGMATVGIENTLEALTRGQVMELIIVANFDQIHEDLERVRALIVPPLTGEGDVPTDPSTTKEVDLAAELSARAKATGARVTFIEDASLMTAYEGVGALLRFTV